MATALNTIVDIELLHRMIEGRYIRVGRHNTCGYTLCDYTPTAQYERVWNAATMLCRGLLLDSDPYDADVNVIGRPFYKFANTGEYGPDSPFGELPEPGRDFDVYDKVDGSLAISYLDVNGNVAFATRGSYHSQQAEAATAWWHNNVESCGGGDSMDADSTLLCEYIAPWNRIVVNYGDTEQLVALARLDIATGADLPVGDINIARVGVWPNFDGLAQVAAHATSGIDGTTAEGYVIRFEPTSPGGMSQRVKVKHDSYIELHRVVTNMTPRTVWEHLSNGGTLEELTAFVPDEFHDELRQVVAELHSERDRRIDVAYEIHAQVTATPYKDRAELAGRVRVACADNPAAAGLVFGIEDGRPREEFETRVFAKMRPAHDVTRRLGMFNQNTAQPVS